MKNKLREKFNSLREGISPDYAMSAASEIASRVLSHPAVRGADSVMVYVSKGSEVGTSPIIRGLLESGRQVFVPVMRGERIAAAKLDSESSLAPGAYGIGEVPEHIREYALPAEIDTVIVPGVCFSSEGKRLGRGGGHFDRFLAKTPAYKIGICYSIQIESRVPQRRHDIRMDEVITEESVLYSLNGRRIQ